MLQYFFSSAGEETKKCSGCGITVPLKRVYEHRHRHSFTLRSKARSVSAGTNITASAITLNTKGQLSEALMSNQSVLTHDQPPAHEGLRENLRHAFERFFELPVLHNCSVCSSIQCPKLFCMDCAPILFGTFAVCEACAKQSHTA